MPTRASRTHGAGPASRGAGRDQEHGGWSMVHRDESSVAVVTPSGTFAGLIPPHRMLGVLLAEHDEDLARLGGYLAGTRASAERRRGAGRAATLAPAALAAVGLAGAMASAADRRRLRGAARPERPAGVLRPGRRLHGGRGRNPDRDAADPRAVGGGDDARRRAPRAADRAIVGVIAAAFLPFALLGWGDGGSPSPSRWRCSQLLDRDDRRDDAALAVPAARDRPGVRLGAAGDGDQDLLSIVVYFAIAVPLAA